MRLGSHRRKIGGSPDLGGAIGPDMEDVTVEDVMRALDRVDPAPIPHAAVQEGVRREITRREARISYLRDERLAAYRTREQRDTAFEVVRMSQDGSAPPLPRRPLYEDR